jgi:hypothetical protein
LLHLLTVNTIDGFSRMVQKREVDVTEGQQFVFLPYECASTAQSRFHAKSLQMPWTDGVNGFLYFKTSLETRCHLSDS